MQAIKIADNIYWVGANVHTEDLFEGIWPIPNGVALNSYLIVDDKITLIELVREWGGASHALIENIKSVPVSIENIDYIVLNHLEPDHTGFTYLLNSIAPKSKIITTQKGAELVKGFYKIEENVIPVKTGDEIELGKRRRLIFTEIPHVHWPETMVSYEAESKILFSGDAFGAFGVHQGCIFDDMTPDVNKRYWEEEMLRYYANIISMFSPSVIKAINQLNSIEIKIIAPSHGLIWKGNPELVIKKYLRYANYNKDFAEPEICIIWGSMYGNTEAMLNAILRGIAEIGIPVNVHRVPNEDASYILADAYKSAGLIIGAPTYEYGMFPPMKYILDLFKKKHIWYKKVLYFGSYGWSGGALKEFNEMSEKMHWDIYDSVVFRGYPTIEQLNEGEKRARQLASEIKKIPSKIIDEE